MSRSASMPAFAAPCVVRGGVARIALEGELDLTTIPSFHRSLARADAEANGRGPPHLLLDLRGLTSMDSAGLRAVLAVAGDAAEHGREFAAVGVNDPVRKLFELAGTTRVLDGTNAVELIERFMAPGTDGVVP